MEATDAATPLVVDVDGTLVNGDLLIEGVARLLTAAPLTLFALPLWLGRGRAALKHRVAAAVPLPPETLALNPAVLDEIATATAAGREVYLASAADARVVAPLVERVGANGYLASDGRTNLAGEAKAEALAARFADGFEYIGDARRDLAVWRRARRAIGVNLSNPLKRKLRALHEDARFLDDDGGASGRPWARTRACLRALRPQQWIKNILVFAPLVAAHGTGAELYLAAAVAFVALSACASAGYVFNDVMDLPHDRLHRHKRHRPIAAGRAPLLVMAGIGAALMAGGVALAFSVSAVTGGLVFLYLLASLAYSLWAKRRVFADVVVLALLYTVRVLIGAAAVSILPSDWFLAFAIFIFLTLAIVKRQTELRGAQTADRTALHGRDYDIEDRVALAALNAASGMASVLVLMLYIHSPEVTAHYARPGFLWLLCPLLIYWLGRVSLLAHRGAVDDDPVAFVLRDRASWWCALVALIALFAAL